MKKVNRWFLMMFIALSTLLVGCGTKTVYVDKVQYIIKTPPESLLKDCKIEQPPDPVGFVQMSDEDRETELTKLVAIHNKNLSLCNTDKRGLRAWTQEQKVLEKKANDERRK
jgi:hypothetical protein